MAWTTDMVTELRLLLNDFDAPQIFTDAKLTALLVVAAKNVSRELSFNQPFVATIANLTIVPDPTTAPTIDDDFSSLTCMQACVILSRSKMIAGGGGIYIRDSISEVDTRQKAANIKAIVDEVAKAYDEAKYQYSCGKRMGRAVLTPFRLGYWGVGNGRVF